MTRTALGAVIGALVVLSAGAVVLVAGGGSSTVEPPAAVPPTTAGSFAPPEVSGSQGTGASPGGEGRCGARIAGYAYSRPFGPTAPWNVPVCDLAPDDRSDDWRDRFWRYARYNPQVAGDADSDPDRGRHGVMFGLDADPARDFAVAIHDAADATGTIRVFQRDGWNGVHNLADGEAIPWNPDWRASGGVDGLMVVTDRATGREWDLWAVVQSDPGGPATGRDTAAIQASSFDDYDDEQCQHHRLQRGLPGGPYVRGADLCVGGANLVRTADGAVADFRTYAGNSPGARGIGIQESAMLVLPEEVAAGEIRHTLMMPIFATMPGVPTCAPGDTRSLGLSCGGALAPAGNFEKEGVAAYGCGAPDAASPQGTAAWERSIPEGTRFALRLSDEEIESWLDLRAYSGALRSTARAFARALADYGWFVTDTSCHGAEFQVASGADPKTARAWRALGISGDGRDLLDGLFTRDRIWTVAPPLNHCVDGSLLQTACPAPTITYPG